MTKFSRFITVLSVMITSLLVAQASLAAPQQVTYEEWFSNTVNKRAAMRLQNIDNQCSGGGIAGSTQCYGRAYGDLISAKVNDMMAVSSLAVKYDPVWRKEVKEMFDTKNMRSSYALCLMTAPSGPAGTRQKIDCEVTLSVWLTLMNELYTKGKWRPYDHDAGNEGE